MVTCSDDRTLKIWDTSADLSQPKTGEGHESWRHLSTLTGYHDRTIFSAHWSSEDIIASGAGDDAICLFAEEKSSMVILPPHICFFHDFSPYVLCLAGLIKFVFTKIHHSSHNLFKLSW